MRVLFLSQVLPYPLDAGPKMRSYYVLRHLVKNHHVTLLTFIRSTDTAADIAHMAGLCHAVHTVPMRRALWRDAKFLAQSILTASPFLIVRDQQPEMVNRVQALVAAGSFDVIHADQLWMAPYALAGGDASAGAKLVLDQHNAVHLIPRRLANDERNPFKRRLLAREARLMTRYELDVCRRFDHVVWVTEEDRRALAALSGPETNGRPPATIIPICADPAQVAPLTPAPGARRITFLGGLHWPPNARGVVWFAREVFPQVRAAVPQAVLTVIGKSPPAELAGDGIDVTGYVTDLMPYLLETAVFIVPLHAGGGMRVKILDAWSWGLPVVSTPIGAEGIDTTPNEDILIADTAPAFARSVIR
ncbi:MAG: glycosyltransferase family 4 protein, partial [Anaerolineae bacterium]